MGHDGPLGARLHHHRERQQGPVQHPGAPAAGTAVGVGVGVDAGEEGGYEGLVVLLLQLWRKRRNKGGGVT